MKKEETNLTKEIFKGISLFLLFFILPLVLQLIFYKLLIKDNLILKSIILLIIELIITIFYIIVNKNEFKGKWKDFKDNSKEYIDIMVKAWVLGFIGMFISNLIINVILNFGLASNEENNRLILKQLYIYAIPSMTILGPITEELAFRASFKKAIPNKKLFVIITSLLFASAHLISGFSGLKDLIYLIPYGSLGFSMSYTYAKTDNVLTNILMHIAHNSLTLLLYFIVL